MKCLRQLSRSCPVFCMNLMGTVQRGADQNIFARKKCEDIRIERLKIGADHEVHSPEPPPGKFGDRLHKVEPKEGFPALELDLDLIDRQVVKKGEHSLKSFFVPVEAFGSHWCPGHLTIGAFQVTSQRRDEDDICWSATDMLTLRPSRQEGGMSEITGFLKGMTLLSKEAGIRAAEFITGVAINECPVSQEVSSRVIYHEDTLVRQFSKSQWPDLHYDASIW